MRETPGSRETPAREIALPAAALAALGRALKDQAGPLAAIHSLHSAGYDAGGPLFDSFVRSLPRAVEDLTERAFWDSVVRFFERRGWGKLTHSSPHPGVGLLTSADWAEADGRRDSQPVCAFSSGLFAHLLTRVADGPVAVLEVSCRAHGDPSCKFAFGSEVAIHDLYGKLLDGSDIDRALVEL